MSDGKAVLFHGFDPAVVAVAHFWAGNTRTVAAVYDFQKCVAILMEDGCTYEEAAEYIEFNMMGAYVGEHTPVFINLEGESSECVEVEEDATE